MLSEVEQRVRQMVFMEDSHLDLDLKVPYLCCYLLFDLSKTTNLEMEKQLETIISVRREGSSFQASWLISIEVLLADKVSDDGASIEDSTRIKSLSHWLHREKEGGDTPTIIVGISDRAAGSPALEAILETCTLHMGQVCLCAFSRDDLLGHDKKREPDAESGVFQQLLYFLPNNASDNLWSPELSTKSPGVKSIDLSKLKIFREVVLFLVVVVVSAAVFGFGGCRFWF